jgi:hypothetical protein
MALDRKLAICAGIEAVLAGIQAFGAERMRADSHPDAAALQKNAERVIYLFDTKSRFWHAGFDPVELVGSFFESRTPELGPCLQAAGAKLFGPEQEVRGSPSAQQRQQDAAGPCKQPDDMPAVTPSSTHPPTHPQPPPPAGQQGA